MALELEWIGTGSAMNQALGNANFSLTHSDRTVLVDCSSSSANVLLSKGSLATIRDIVITHAHGDHMDGLESIGFFNYYALGRRDAETPTVYVGSESVRDAIIASLSPKMARRTVSDKDAEDITKYFQFKVSKSVEIAGMPTINLHPTDHADNLDCFGVHIPQYRTWISGDSREVLPLPIDTQLAFRDAGGPHVLGRVHASLDDLAIANAKEHTFLYHLGGNWKSVADTRNGFAGIVLPGDRFSITENKYLHDHSHRHTFGTLPYR